jgi:hypothetical protein
MYLNMVRNTANGIFFTTVKARNSLAIVKASNVDLQPELSSTRFSTAIPGTTKPFTVSLMRLEVYFQALRSVELKIAY